MDDQRPKRALEGDLQFETAFTKRQKRMVSETDYMKCIICQNEGVNLYRVQSDTQKKLLLAMDARFDHVAVRLEHDVKCDVWLTNEPKWHDKCRNVINEKSYMLAKRKRANTSIDASSSADIPSCSSKPARTRSQIETFDAKSACVICNRHWHKGKEPTSKVSTKQAQKTIHDRAERLDRQDILHRLVGQGCDMVANDICYHTPCMNKFKATRVTSGKSREQQLYDTAFSDLVDELETPLFEESQGFFGEIFERQISHKA